MAHICNPSPWGAEAGVQGHFWLNRQFQANLSYRRPCLKIKEDGNRGDGRGKEGGGEGKKPCRD